MRALCWLELVSSGAVSVGSSLTSVSTSQTVCLFNLSSSIWLWRFNFFTWKTCCIVAHTTRSMNVFTVSVCLSSTTLFVFGAKNGDFFIFFGRRLKIIFGRPLISIATLGVVASHLQAAHQRDFRFDLFFSFSFSFSFASYQTCWRRRVDDLPKYRPPLVTDSTLFGRSTRKRRIVC